MRRAIRNRIFGWPAWLLVGCVTLVWCWHYDRWTPGQWELPTSYSGDAHETLARLQAASEGAMWPGQPQRIERLGAPFGAYWNAYPTPDKLLMLALGGVARVAGVFVAANLGLWLAQVTAALAFFVVARWLRARVEWAFAGAMLFAYTCGTFSRGLAHFSLLFSWTVPLGLWAVWLVARSRRLEWRRPGAWLCVAAAAVVGAHNPYNLYFWLQLLGWALVAQWVGPRRRPNLQIGLAALGVSLAVFILMHLETWVHIEEPEGSPLLVRNYGGTERYALKPVELLIPPQTHRWAPLAFLGSRYARWSEWRGEEFTPYLGLIGIAGLAWIAAVAARRVFRNEPAPGQALPLGWLTVFSSVGGVTNVLAFFAGLQVFRATNRVGIFLSGIILFFVFTRLSRATAGWPRAAQWVAALVLTAVGILDQVPPGPSRAQQQEIAAAVASDLALGREMEARLSRGAMVFQLPVQGFPEVVPPWQLRDYELFRPYLVTTSLRLSYGAAKGRSRIRWQRDLQGAPTEELVRQLEDYGFAALFLNRKGFEDRADSMLRDLDALGYRERIQSKLGNQVMVRLHPSAHPRPPLAQQLTFGQGWHPPSEEGVRWAFGDAVVSYYNPYRNPVAMDLHLAFVAVGPRRITLLHEGEPVGETLAGPERREVRITGLVLHPGVNRFKLRTDEPPDRLGRGRYLLRSFGLVDSSLDIRAGEPAVSGQ